MLKQQDKRIPMIYMVKSESNPNQEYTITHYHKNEWRCSCRDYVFRSVDPNGIKKQPPYYCKHIKKKIEETE